MVKSELINQIAMKQENLSLKDVELSVNHIIEKMSDALGRGDRIEIRGFGSFSLHYRPPRRAHNPKTGERVHTTAKHTPHFKPGKDLRDRVNANRHLYEITSTKEKDLDASIDIED
ncbi:MAG: integration host factor subunit beta [Gammaproteobacteria bacterium]|nr:integration host factor subunit beta [Gammaproteobacteria bacterium]